MTTKFMVNRRTTDADGNEKDRAVCAIFHIRQACSDFGRYTFRWTLPAGHNKRWSWSKKIQFYFNFPLGVDAAWLFWCRLAGCKLHIQGRVLCPFKQPFIQRQAGCFFPRALQNSLNKGSPSRLRSLSGEGRTYEISHLDRGMWDSQNRDLPEGVIGFGQSGNAIKICVWCECPTAPWSLNTLSPLRDACMMLLYHSAAICPNGRGEAWSRKERLW